MFPIAALAAGFLSWERLAPARALPTVPNWTLRLVFANLVQLVVVLAVGPLCARVARPLLPLDAVPDVVAAGGVYLLSTLVWYAWHRARHESRALWLGLHQLHHSPARIEVAMAFYKHPLEQVANALLSGAIAGPLFGLSPGAAVAYAALSAGAEFVYHSNVRTPRWLGYLVQRPEMHRVHHARGRHTCNYSDLPLWDLLFGTFANPETMDEDCGFEPDQEARVGAMLLFQDVVSRRRTRPRQLGLALLLLVGLASVGGTLLTPLAPRAGPALAGLGKLTLASPFPKVFSGMEPVPGEAPAPVGAPTGRVEPWAYERVVTLTLADGTERMLPFDAAVAAHPVGPYMLRNAYGAAVAYGPWLPDATVQTVLRHAVCVDPTFRPALGLPNDAPPVRVAIDAHPAAGLPGPIRHVEVSCS